MFFYNYYLGVVKEKYIIHDLNYIREHVCFHGARVARSVAGFTEFLELDRLQRYKMIELAVYHDIGKFGIDPDILFKSGRLSIAGMECIKKHSIYGEDYIKCIKNLSGLSTLVRHHHERWDGCGYPDGLAADEIPIECRILALSDAFDAMTSNRCYRNALDIEEALHQIDRGGGHQFDPHLSQQFIEYIELHNRKLKDCFKKGRAASLYNQMGYSLLFL